MSLGAVGGRRSSVLLTQAEEWSELQNPHSHHLPRAPPSLPLPPPTPNLPRTPTQSSWARHVRAPSPILPTLFGLLFRALLPACLGLEVTHVCVSVSPTLLGAPGEQRSFDLPFLSLQSKQRSLIMITPNYKMPATHQAPGRRATAITPSIIIHCAGRFLCPFYANGK